MITPKDESTGDGRLELDIPTDEENARALSEFFGGLREVAKERVAAMEEAFLALPRLAEAMANKSGQSYKIREMLFSLWAAGAKADLSELMNLDWTLRKDVCAVLLAFGFEDEDGSRSLWYDDLIKALRPYRLEGWFREAAGTEVAA